ncbi:TonB-dependent receptor [Hymenobacter sp.]|uniref:SusC/RagA family TonB-linked outer membrane protein n=1 Tax=Hymenobacter sp. TaxID=1898978 RepID=UPI00286C3986|nr:TonB-dependent receptor [Hymenobacter sp.]
MRKILTLYSLITACAHLSQPAQAQLLAAAPRRHSTAQDTPGTQPVRTLKSALAELETRYKVYIVADNALLEGKTVTSPLAGAPLENVLLQLLQGSQLTYRKVEASMYVIVPAGLDGPSRPVKAGSPTTAVPLGGENAIGGALPRLEQAPAKPLEEVVTGRVTTGNGEGLPGVTVVLKGTTVGTSTDADGRYSLRLPDLTGTLVFSFVGFTTREVPLSGRTSLDIALEQDVKALNEVVVVGYGTQSRATVTGAVASIKGEDIANVPQASVDALIQGRAAGVQVTQNSGAPGSGISVRVRGTTSISAGNEPLYIIDGVPVNTGNYSGISEGNRFAGDDGSNRGGTNALADINPSDIESIEVLKDASASAIYGARAANGVVLITTKRGKANTATINFNAYYGIQQTWRRLNMLPGSEQRQLLIEARLNAGAGLASFLLTPESEVTNVNWQDEIFRTAPISNYDLSFRGGNEKARYAVSLGYFDQRGVIIESGFKRFSGRVNLDYEISKKLRFGNSLTVSRTDNDRIESGDAGSAILSNALRALSFLPVYTPSGAYNINLEGAPNPVATAREQYLDNKSNRLVGNVFGEFDILNGLTLRSSFGADFIGVKDDRFDPSTTAQGGLRRSYARFTQDLVWINTNTLSYRKKIGEAHDLALLLGNEQQLSQREFIETGGQGAATNTVPTVNAAAQLTNGSTFKTSWGLSSLFARLNYSLLDRYLFQVNLRRDVSSRFGDNNKDAVFPSASIGWRVSQEAFMRGLPALSNLKLRASAGVTGNQNIGNFAALGLLRVGNNYGTLAGIAPSALGDPNLSWESTTQYNAGLDLGFFNERVVLLADVYRKTTNDLLLAVPLPGTSGYGSATRNVGQIRNEGAELALITQNLVGDFTWNTNFNISSNRNKILQLNEFNEDIIQASGLNAFGQSVPFGIARVGESIGSIYGFRMLGVYPTDQANDNGLRDDRGQLYQGGDAIYEDINQDGVINNDDRVVIGNAVPKFVGGLTNTFTYKNIDLSVFLQGSYGNDVFNQSRAVLNNMFTNSASTTEVRERWRYPGDITDVPRALQGDQRNALPSTRWLEDGSYLRLKNVTLGYRIPKSISQRAYIQNLRVYATAQNLLTLTKYKGLDPEVNFLSNPLESGIDYGTFPQARTVMLGVNFGF